MITDEDVERAADAYAATGHLPRLKRLRAALEAALPGVAERCAKIADDYAVRMEHAAAKRYLAGKPNTVPTSKQDAARSIAAAIRKDEG